MAVNKVIFGGETVVDLTKDTVTPNTLLSGYTAHDKTGTRITGTASASAKPRYAEILISGGTFDSEGWFVEEWGENVWRITPDYITPPTLTANSKIDLVTHPLGTKQLINEGCTLQAVNNNGSWEIYALGAYPPMLDYELMAEITEVQQ